MAAACFGEVLQLYNSHVLSPTQSPGDRSDSGDLGATAGGVQLEVSPPEVTAGAGGKAFGRLTQMGRGGRVGGGSSGAGGGGSSSPEGEGDLDQVYAQISAAMRQDGFLPAGAAGGSGSGGRMRGGTGSSSKPAATGAAAAAAAAAGVGSRRRVVPVARVGESEGPQARPPGAAYAATKASAAAGAGEGVGDAAPAAAGGAGEGVPVVVAAARCGTAAASNEQQVHRTTPVGAAAATGAAKAPIQAASAAAPAAGAAAGVARSGPLQGPGSPTPTTDMDWLGLDPDSALQQVAVFAWPDLH